MSDLILRPSWRFLLSRPAHLIAFGFGAGLMPVAPGTFGTLVAFPLFWLLHSQTSALEFMLWDETVAFLLVLFFVPTSLTWQASLAWQGAAFLLFRLFDILKPPPIRYYDRTFKSGFGVMLDDLVAAFYTLLVLAIAKMLLA
jgi:phosphatidylglycerophosphatase A